MCLHKNWWCCHSFAANNKSLFSTINDLFYLFFFRGMVKYVHYFLQYKTTQTYVTLDLTSRFMCYPLLEFKAAHCSLSAKTFEIHSVWFTRRNSANFNRPYTYEKFNHAKQATLSQTDSNFSKTGNTTFISGLSMLMLFHYEYL